MKAIFRWELSLVAAALVALALVAVAPSGTRLAYADITSLEAEFDAAPDEADVGITAVTDTDEMLIRLNNNDNDLTNGSTLTLVGCAYASAPGVPVAS